MQDVWVLALTVKQFLLEENYYLMLQKPSHQESELSSNKVSNKYG